MTPLTKVTVKVLWTAGILLGLAAPVTAQNTAFGGTSGYVRPIELSVGGAGVLGWPTSGVSFRAQLVIPLDDRKSLEIFAGPYQGGHGDDFLGDIKGSYGFEFTRRLNQGRWPGLQLFLSSGAEGAVVRDRFSSCFTPGCAPGSRTYVLPPLIWMFGFGVQKTLSPHYALRIEAHGLFALVVPLGVRAGISLAIPLGQTYRTTAKR